MALCIFNIIRFGKDTDIDRPLEIYLEIGKKKTFACAIAWPGWCRSGLNEVAAVQALLRYAPRYNSAVALGDLAFNLPNDVADFTVIDRIEGNFATDFGVPDLPIARDYVPLDRDEVEKFSKIVQASWRAFDKTTQQAQGKQLRKGPRGGGRELTQIIDHVIMAERGYLRQLGCGPLKLGDGPVDQQAEVIRGAVLNGIQAAADGQIVSAGPHGGKRWPLAYFFRRLVWHCVDHTWEIEDRIL